MNNKLSIILCIVCIGVGLLLLVPKKSNQIYYVTQLQLVASSTQYTNLDYGFMVSLPESWEKYKAVESGWEGYSLDTKGENQVKSEKGPLFLIRHPLWTTTAPRQDIPVMIFTLKQWSDMQADKFHIGAAPVNPSELGRNSKYVFALPARYNFSYLTGFEEVDQIVRSGSVKAF